MNKDLFDQYLRDYVREALIYGDQNVDQAANHLLNQRKPRFLAKKERKIALERAQKVFSAYRDRPLWFVLKCLGIEADEFKKS
jgi:hypothetical protein